MIVLIGDIIDSKQLDGKKREQVQSQLLDQFDVINRESGSIEAPFTITLGDEFQAVYADASTLWEDCWKILAALHPVSVRFSAAIGSISTPINKKQSIGMDGPAFYIARDRIEEMKKSKQLFNIDIEEAENDSETQAVVNLMNSSLKLLSNEMKRWKKIRFQILVMLNSGMPVKEIAKELNVSESAVYKNREDGGLSLVIELKESVKKLLNIELTRRKTS
ncbi:MAG: SatD family protein [Balneolaceae bacterium]